MDLNEIVWMDLEWIHLAQHKDQWQAVASVSFTSCVYGHDRMTDERWNGSGRVLIAVISKNLLGGTKENEHQNTRCLGRDSSRSPSE
jgi:hypothetical protein